LKTQIQAKKTILLLALLISSSFIILQISFFGNDFSALGSAGTQVGGQINSDTTWTAVNSPYILNSSVIIPENITLTIEPGVTITNQAPNNTMFLVSGTIRAHGNVANKITFDGNGYSMFFKTYHPVSAGFVDLDYCVIKNGLSVFWFDNTGFLNITNSDLRDLSEYSYLWYPSEDSYIEYNSFINATGMKIGTDDYYANASGSVYIRYNLFSDSQGFVINNYASCGLSKIHVNNNSFTNCESPVLEVEKTSTTADMDASQNFWGTNDTAIIESMIYDENDDPNCTSYILYLPILDGADPETPIAPTPTPSPTEPPITPTETPSSTNSPDPSSSPSPSTSPTATPTTSPNSPTTNPDANPTTNPDTTQSTPNPSDTSANTDSQNNPTQQPVKDSNPKVQANSNNYIQIGILLGLVVLALGLIGYFAKHRR